MRQKSRCKEQFSKSDNYIDVTDLVEAETFTSDQLAYLWLSVENRKSIMFTGEISTEISKVLNAVSMFIPKRYEVFNVGDLSYQDMKKPQEDDFVLVDDPYQWDEVSNHNIFGSMNSLSVFHSNSIESALSRLDLSFDDITELDVVCKLSRKGNNIYVDSISEIEGFIEDSEIIEGSQLYNSSAKLYEGTESSVMEEISLRNVMTEEELVGEMDDRKKVIEQIVEENINDYKKVDYVIQTYMDNKPKVMNAVEQGKLNKLIDYETN